CGNDRLCRELLTPGPPHQFTVVSGMSQLRWSESKGTEPHHGSNVTGSMPGRVTLRRRIASLKSSCHALCNSLCQIVRCADQITCLMRALRTGEPVLMGGPIIFIQPKISSTFM